MEEFLLIIQVRNVWAYEGVNMFIKLWVQVYFSLTGQLYKFIKGLYYDTNYIMHGFICLNTGYVRRKWYTQHLNSGMHKRKDN